MNTLRDLDHARLRRAERHWLDQCADRLRAARQQTTDDRNEGTER